MRASLRYFGSAIAAMAAMATSAPITPVTPVAPPVPTQPGTRKRLGHRVRAGTGRRGMFALPSGSVSTLRKAMRDARRRVS